MKSSPSSAAREPAGVRRRDARVAGHRDQRPDLALARRLDLVGQRGDRQLAERLGQPAHARRPAADREAAPRLAGRVGLARGGEREHRAALAVEVAGQHVEDVDQPARERAERLRRRADAAVDGGALGGGELARHAADLLRRRCPSAPATASGVNGHGQRLDRLDARRPARPAASSPSSNSTCTSANSSSASVPGRIGWCSSACSAVRERRGSTTTTLPPRSRIARSRPRASGAVISEPLEASGFAPEHSRCIVRSRSGTGIDSGAAEHQARPRRAWASGRRSTP